MKQTNCRFWIVLLVLSMWLATTGFQPFSPAAAPAAFGKTSPTNGATGQPIKGMKLSWNATTTQGVAYWYCISTNQKVKCPGNKWVNAGAYTTVTLPTTLSANTVYYWQVKAVLGANTTYADNNTWWSFRTQPLPGTFSKTSPANQTSGLSVSSVKLTWETTSSNAERYEYCVDTTNDNTCNNSWVNMGTANSATPPNLVANTLYYWQVRAANGSGSTMANAGTWWSFSTRVLPEEFTKASPALNATNQPVDHLTLTWNASGGATSYDYCYTTDAACTTWSKAGNLTSVTLPPLLPDRDYIWQVRAVNSYGSTEADGKTPWKFHTQIAAPSAFGKLSPANQALDLSTSVSLTWEANSGPSITYQYCIDTTLTNPCGGNWTTVSSTSTAPLALNYETTYYWQVRAVNTTATVPANGGTWWSFKTRTAPPAAFHKTSPANGAPSQAINPTLEWGSSSANASYEYCYDTINNGQCDNGWFHTTNTTVSLTALDYAATYYWQVRAVNPSGTTYADGINGWFSFQTLNAPPVPFNKANPANNDINLPNQIFLNWYPSSGVEYYQYCLDKDQNSACDSTWVKVGTSTTVGPIAVDYNATYSWQVQAVNSSGTVEANHGQWFTFKPLPAAPEPNSKISPMTNATYRQLNTWLYWSASSGATSYQYCVDETDDNACDGETWHDVGSATSVQLSVLQAPVLYRNRTYYWQVRAVSSGPTYAYANSGAWWKFTTLGEAPMVDTSKLSFSTPEDNKIEGQLTATSAAGLALEYDLVGRAPAGSFQLFNNGSFTFTPPAYMDGTFTFQFTVSDGYNAPVGPYKATIEVTPVENAPVLGLISDQKVTTGNLLTFLVTASDPDLPYGDQLKFSLSSTAPAGASIDPDSGRITWTPSWSNKHTQPYVFDVIVTDKDGKQDAKPVHIQVDPLKMMLSITFR